MAKTDKAKEAGEPKKEEAKPEVKQEGAPGAKPVAGQEAKRPDIKGPGQGEEASMAVVLKVFGRTGVHGEVNHILCRILSGRDKGKTIKRNLKGPVKVNDKIVLLETEREAKAISSRR